MQIAFQSAVTELGIPFSGYFRINATRACLPILQLLLEEGSYSFFSVLFEGILPLSVCATRKEQKYQSGREEQREKTNFLEDQ